MVEVVDLDVRGGRVHPTKILRLLNLPAESGLYRCARLFFYLRYHRYRR
jgi:hypothetical protein